MKKVSSSHVDSYEYNPEKKILTVVFKNGKTYEYHDVHPHEHAHLELAASKGSHLHRHIFSKKRGVVK
jgi:hypothetical protein